MTPAPRALPRRTVLAASGTALLAAAAACSSGTPAATSSSTAPAGTPASSTPPSSAAGSTASSAAGSTTASSAAIAPPATTADAGTPTAEPTAAPTGNPLVSVADVESAGAVIANGPDGPVLLAASGGSVVGHSATCTHLRCALPASGVCRCHGSEFDVVTGAVLKPPAQQPLPEFAVTVSGGQVYAG